MKKGKVIIYFFIVMLLLMVTACSTKAGRAEPITTNSEISTKENDASSNDTGNETTSAETITGIDDKI